jgi:RNA polymerase sigma factor (sigma-70 family)
MSIRVSPRSRSRPCFLTLVRRQLEIPPELHASRLGSLPAFSRGCADKLAARLMRNVLVDHARACRAMKRGGALEALTLEHVPLDRAPEILEVNEALDQLAKVDERKAQVIELRYFGGMSREEIAGALGLRLPTVKRDLRLGEAWLRRFLAGENPT